MSSREIAALTGKQHFHIKRDIQRMLEELEVDSSNFGYTYRDGLNCPLMELGYFYRQAGSYGETYVV